MKGDSEGLCLLCFAVFVHMEHLKDVAPFPQASLRER